MKERFAAASAGARLRARPCAQLPFEAPRALGIHGHVFVNGGSAELLAGTGRPMREAAHEFVRAFRWTAVRLLASFAMSAACMRQTPLRGMAGTFEPPCSATCCILQSRDSFLCASRHGVGRELLRSGLWPWQSFCLQACGRPTGRGPGVEHNPRAAGGQPVQGPGAAAD